MKPLNINESLVYIFSSILLAGLLCSAESGPKSLVEVTSGTTTFDASTNMPGVEVRGKSSTVSGRVEVSQEANDLVLRHMDASVPVRSLATGMKVRDEHMRKYIFTTADGKEPDLRFTAETASCPPQGVSHQFACQIQGSLSIRGVSHPVELRLRVKQQSGSEAAFRVEGEGLVKLSDYGIDAPSQFGVKPANEVKFHLEFTGREKPSNGSPGAGQ